MYPNKNCSIQYADVKLMWKIRERRKKILKKEVDQWQKSAWKLEAKVQ